MCLTVIGDRVRYKIATRDIVVYKILTKKGRSPYQRMKYEPHTKYVTQIGRPDKEVWLSCCSYWYIEQGLHAFIKPLEGSRFRNMMDGSRAVVHEMIIPKGARYVVGDEGDVVSTSLYTGDMKPYTMKQFLEVYKG